MASVLSKRKLDHRDRHPPMEKAGQDEGRGRWDVLQSKEQLRLPENSQKLEERYGPDPASQLQKEPAPEHPVNADVYPLEFGDIRFLLF